MNAVFVIVWLIAMAIIVMMRQYWLRGNYIGYLYAAYELTAAFIAVLVASAPGGAMYAFAIIAAVGLPIGLLVDRRRHPARHQPMSTVRSGSFTATRSCWELPKR
jgi:hypothetical protein